MRPQWLALYHALPAPLRSWAATARGLHLQHWRRGRDSEQLEQQALERDRWSDEQWRDFVEDRRARILHIAATRVPWYREHWAARRRRGDRAAWDLLENWPQLEKEDLRAHPRAFLVDGADPRRMFHEHTSGTTGKPLDLWRTRETVRTLYAIARARGRHWHGIAATARFARLGGQLVIPVRQRRPPFWVWNGAMRQLYMSTYHLAPDLIPWYLAALREYRIIFLAGYTSALAALARHALQHGYGDLQMRAAITNAEPVTREQREVIGRAFQTRVVETYGMAEAVAAASECEAGQLHQWPEIGHIEIADVDATGPDGDVGEYLCTGLLNAEMPLIRYRVGDRGTEPRRVPCACGRTLPVIASVQGRLTDLLITRDGRRVFWLNPVFYGLPVRESQIEQNSLDTVVVRVVPGPGFGAETGRILRDRLRERLGPIEVAIDLVTEIPRTPAGKLRAVICNVGTEDEYTGTDTGTAAGPHGSEQP